MLARLGISLFVSLFALATLYSTQAGAQLEVGNDNRVRLKPGTVATGASLEAGDYIAVLAGTAAEQQEMIKGINAAMAQNHNEAFRAWLPLAERGFPEMQTNIALMYLRGEGAGTDLGKAIAWLRKAANNNDATGQVYLGRVYDDGIGVEKDRKQAAEWYAKAASQGDTEGLFNLGSAYL